MKANLLWAVTILILLGIIFYLYTCHEPPKEPEVITEIEYIKGDTVTIYKEKKIFVSSVDTIKIIEGDTLTTHYDSTFISEKDTILIFGADVYIKDRLARWDIDIDYREVEKIITDTLKIKETIIEPPTFFDKVKDVTFIIILVEIALAVLIFLTGGL